MRKALVSLFAAAAIAAPLAHAESTPITVELKYDSTLLATEAGAKTVLKSIKRQATKACAFVMPVTGMPTFDRGCRDDLVDKAIGEIRVAALEDGQALTYVFASLDIESDVTAR